MTLQIDKRRNQLRAIAAMPDGWWQLLQLRRRLKGLGSGYVKEDYKLTTDMLINEILDLEAFRLDSGPQKFV